MAETPEGAEHITVAWRQSAHNGEDRGAGEGAGRAHADDHSETLHIG
jgi:hypothetical protein